MDEEINDDIQEDLYYLDDDPLDDEEFQKAMAEWVEEERRLKKLYFEKYGLFRKASLEPLNMTDEEYDELYGEQFDPDMYDYIGHIGYCDAEKVEGYRNCFYPDHDFYTLKNIQWDSEISEYFKGLKDFKFMEQDLGETNLKMLVWQMTGPCDDEYSGFLCFPLPEGRWWLCQYHC